MRARPDYVPTTTYRLQMGKEFGFAATRELLNYFDELGVTTVYLSPLFQARESSSHGYDVVDHAHIDAAFGTEQDFGQLADALVSRGMGLMLDVVPNHMGINSASNMWWHDVLARGPYSSHAAHFDIDWAPAKESMRGRVLLPFLGEPFGEALEGQRLTLDFDGARFIIRYHDRVYPVAAPTWPIVLQAARETLANGEGATNGSAAELDEIIAGFGQIPWGASSLAVDSIERARREDEACDALARLVEKSPAAREAIDSAVRTLNGRAQVAESFDRLESLLSAQAYRLSYWRVATEEINFRRFFDINDLAAIRVERPEVFEAVHELVFRYVARGWVQALRIDHPDGLVDPRAYFEALQLAYRGGTPHSADRADGVASVDGERAIYVAVEKILGTDEAVPADWPVAGTTGYEYLNLINRLFVDRDGAAALSDQYMRWTRVFTTFPNVVYESKKAVLRHSMSSELTVLAAQLERIAERHRSTRDFTLSTLRAALAETIACFPVYRTYVRRDDEPVADDDRRRIATATRTAAWRNPEMSRSLFEFLAALLLKNDPDGIDDEARAQRREFALKFQQVTGPVMAKGVEDTAFYRFFPLASLNEVGGDPWLAAESVEDFHRAQERRAVDWPYSMTATATHDTKRGEDFRARLNVLSETPAEWASALTRWKELNQPHMQKLDGHAVPDANEQYLLYQTLVGAWPAHETSRGDIVAAATPPAEFADRVATYMTKAIKEAKVHTSWLNPCVEYERALETFIQRVLAPDNEAFLRDLAAFIARVADAGYVNALAQALLKMTLPGVPDFYQGTELWDFNLVDPDNRRAVDFESRRRMLQQLKQDGEADLAAAAAKTLADWPSPLCKLLLVWRTLHFRRQHAKLFLDGEYLPLAVVADKLANVLGFARVHDGVWCVVVVPRLTLLAGGPPLGQTRATAESAAAWSAFGVQLPTGAPRAWRHIVTGATLTAEPLPGGDQVLSCGDVFATFPVAILEGEPLPAIEQPSSTARDDHVA